MNRYKLCSESIVYEREDEDESITDIVNTAEATRLKEYLIFNRMQESLGQRGLQGVQNNNKSQ